MIAPWDAVLDSYPASSGPISPVNSLGNSGGLSGARLWRYDSGRGPMVLRAWPEDGPDLARIGMIHGWLKKAADLGFVSVPVETLQGRTIVSIDDRLWEVAPWMPGRADLSRPPALERIQAGFRGLAAFLGRIAEGSAEGQSPGLRHRAIELDRLILGEFATFRTILDRSPLDPRATAARRWLDRAIRWAPELVKQVRQVATHRLPIQPCLRDVRPDHFLFDGGRLSGLIDFGAMDRDTVAGDLARLLAEGVGPSKMAREAALRAFESVRPLSGLEVRAIEAFEQANALLGPARWIRWHFIDRRSFEDPDAVGRGLRRGLERLEETFGRA